MKETATHPRTLSTREQRADLLKASYDRMQADLLAGRVISDQARRVLLDLIERNCPHILKDEKR